MSGNYGSKMQYGNETFFNADDGGEYVADWVRSDDKLPVRVQAYRKFVRDRWHLKWADQAPVKARFDVEKLKHLDRFKKGAVLDSTVRSYGVYVIKD
ncbi:MAG: hypothetical protein ACAH24_13540 [Hyphomicrobiaceae bacterium]